MTSAKYQLADYALDKTPARNFRLDRWPKRDSLTAQIRYHEWFDWSELFSVGAPGRLTAICREFSSLSVRIACLATDDPALILLPLRVIEMDRDRLLDSYFKAIWDKGSTSLSAELAAAARVVVIWDTTEQWFIVNDRFYEIGLFAAIGIASSTFKESFFDRLEEHELLDRFSKILRSGKVDAWTEIRRWSE